jgi:hypothetical protein
MNSHKISVGDIYRISKYMKVRIICVDRLHDFPILGLVKIKSLNEEYVVPYRESDFTSAELIGKFN